MANTDDYGNWIADVIDVAGELPEGCRIHQLETSITDYGASITIRICSSNPYGAGSIQSGKLSSPQFLGGIA